MRECLDCGPQPLSAFTRNTRGDQVYYTRHCRECSRRRKLAGMYGEGVTLPVCDLIRTHGDVAHLLRAWR